MGCQDRVGRAEFLQDSQSHLKGLVEQTMLLALFSLHEAVAARTIFHRCLLELRCHRWYKVSPPVADKLAIVRVRGK
jgi:hypothetical protein